MGINMSSEMHKTDEYAAHYVMYTHDFFLEDSIESVYPYVDQILIARTLRPWFGEPVDLVETEKALEKVMNKYGDKIEIFEDEFPDEHTQRNFLLNISQKRNHRGAFIVDCDEIFIGKSFERIYEFIKQNNPASLRIPYLTFIKDASFCVAAPYEQGLFYITPIPDAQFTFARKSNLTETEMPYEEPEIIHFSYIREKDEHIWAKVNSFMHFKDTDWNSWYRDVYLNFHPYLENFHPVWPESWSKLELFNENKFGPNLLNKLQSNGKLFYNQKINKKNEVKLHLGCGPKILDGYINIDLYSPYADIKLDITDLSYFANNSVDEIFMNAVFEHLYTFEQIPALREWRRVLKPNGKLRINSIPDFDVIADAYYNKQKGNCGEVFNLYEVTRYSHGDYTPENRLGQIHKDLFTKEKVDKLLKEAGFTVQLIEDVHWEKEPVPCNINIIAVKPDGLENPLSPYEQKSLVKSASGNVPTNKFVNNSVKLNETKSRFLSLIEKDDYFEAYLFLKKNIGNGNLNSGINRYEKDLEKKIKARKNNIGWNSRKSAKTLLEAEKFIEKQKLNAAKEKLFTVLNLEPQHIEALNDLSVISILENNYEYAYELINVLLSIEPGNDVAEGNLKYLLEVSPNLEKKTKNIKSSIKIDKPHVIGSPKLSVNLIVLNEVDFIDLWLENTVPFVDEIVIIDGGSTDGTIEKIKNYNSDKIKIIFWKQESAWYSDGWNEPARRNLALIQSTGDWILKKDVDELFLEEDYKKIRRIMESNDEHLFCFPRYSFWGDINYIRVNTELDPHWYPDYQGNLWRANLGLKYSSESLHSYLCLNGEQYNEASIYNDLHIYHYHWAIGKKIKINDLRRGDLLNAENFNQMPAEVEDKRVDEKILNWEKEGIRLIEFDGAHPLCAQKYFKINEAQLS
jgi:predicted SAM-dependent methyltransferase